MPTKLLSFFLLGILFFQITTVSVTPIIPIVSIGSMSVIEKSGSYVIPLRSRPLAQFSSPERNQYESIIFVGDIMLGRFVEQLMMRKGDDYPFATLPLATLANKPAIVGNFEASIPLVHVPTPNYQLQFSVPVSSLNILKDVGFTHFSLANNHSFDHGKAGYENSLNALQNDFVAFGSEIEITKQSLIYIETTAGPVALLGVNNSNRAVDAKIISELLEEAATKSIVQIVYVHWGIEYETQHSKAQKRLATIMVEAGADLIVGHHPHVVQDIDSIHGVPVFYSLGNYIFDQYFSKAVQEGLVISMDISNEEFSIYLHPVSSIGTLSQPHLKNEVNQRQFLDTLAARSHLTLSSAISAGKITIPLQFATSSKMAMIKE